MEPPPFKPMLAASGPIRGDASAWAFEPKLDGWRALVRIRPGKVVVTTRTGRDVTAAVPELAPLASALGSHAVVLDGELVADDGTPSTFYRLGPRLSSRRTPGAAHPTPVSFVAFDCLWSDGRDLTGEPYLQRRRVLEDLALRGPSWCTGSTFPGDGAELFAACVELGLEGLMAKRLDGRYYPGERKPVWIKAKTLDWRSGHARARHRR